MAGGLTVLRIVT